MQRWNLFPPADPAVKLLIVLREQRLQPVEHFRLQGRERCIPEGAEDQVHLFCPAPPAAHAQTFLPHLRSLIHLEVPLLCPERQRCLRDSENP